MNPFPSSCTKERKSALCCASISRVPPVKKITASKSFKFLALYTCFFLGCSVCAKHKLHAAPQNRNKAKRHVLISSFPRVPFIVCQRTGQHWSVFAAASFSRRPSRFWAVTSRLSPGSSRQKPD